MCQVSLLHKLVFFDTWTIKNKNRTTELLSHRKLGRGIKHMCSFNKLHSLKTNSSPQKMMVSKFGISFFQGEPIFRCKLLVSGRVRPGCSPSFLVKRGNPRFWCEGKDFAEKTAGQNPPEKQRLTYRWWFRNPAITTWDVWHLNYLLTSWGW